MGRRLMLIVGMAILASPVLPAAPAQDATHPPPPPSPTREAAAPEINAAPSLLSNEFVNSLAPLPADGNEKAASAAQKKRGGPNGAARSRSNRRDAAQDEKVKDPQYDPQVQRVQNAPAEQGQAPPIPTPAGAELRTPPVSGIANSPALNMDQLSFGKQSVGVSVDVIGPSSMYLNQEATLKLIVRNNGKSDALNVAVTDELPKGLRFVSSQPEAAPIGDGILTWSIGLLPSGSDRLITLRVRPTEPGSFEHGATVKVLTGSKTRLKVMEPKLKVDLAATPTIGKVLKGQSVEFKVSVTNTGDGPARMWPSRPS